MDETILTRHQEEEARERQKMQEEAAAQRWAEAARAAKEIIRLQAANNRWQPTGNRERPEELWAFLMGREPIKKEKKKKGKN